MSGPHPGADDAHEQAEGMAMGERLAALLDEARRELESWQAACTEAGFLPRTETEGLLVRIGDALHESDARGRRALAPQRVPPALEAPAVSAADERPRRHLRALPGAAARARARAHTG